MQFQQIEEYVVQEQVVSKRVEFKIEVIPMSKAIVRAYFYNDDNDIDPVAVKIVVIENEDYSQWGTDDNWVIDYVYEKLGLVKSDLSVDI